MAMLVMTSGWCYFRKDQCAATCTIKKSPQCYKLHERFLFIRSVIDNERDELLEHTDMLQQVCEETENTLEGQIQDDKVMLSNARTNWQARLRKRTQLK